MILPPASRCATWTPVPGTVDPMTIATLMTHTVEAADHPIAGKPGKTTHGAHEKKRKRKADKEKTKLAKTKQQKDKIQTPARQKERNRRSRNRTTEVRTENLLRPPIRFGDQSAMLQMKMKSVSSQHANLGEP